MQIFFLKITITIITAHIEITPVILHLVFFILFFFGGGAHFSFNYKRKLLDGNKKAIIL